MSYNTMRSQLDPNLDTYLAGLRGRATFEAEQPYERYMGERFAEEPLAERKANDIMFSELGGWGEPLMEAQGLYRQGATPFPHQYEHYMNPYQQQVVRGMSEEANRNFTDEILPALQAQFVRKGQHGGLRHREEAAKAAREMQMGLSRLQGQFMHEGYEQGAQTHESDMMRRLRAAELAARVSQATQSQVGQDVNNLMTLGESTQARQQQLRNFEYQQHLERQRYRKEQLNFEAGIARGMPYSQHTTEHRQGTTNPMRGHDYRMMGLGAFMRTPWAKSMFGGS